MNTLPEAIIDVIVDHAKQTQTIKPALRARLEAMDEKELVDELKCRFPDAATLSKILEERPRRYSEKDIRMVVMAYHSKCQPEDADKKAPPFRAGP